MNRFLKKNNKPESFAELFLYTFCTKLVLANYLIIILSFFSSAALAKQKLSFSTGTTFLTGDYGNSEKTEIFYTPFAIKYKYNNFNFKLTVPYLEKTGPKNVIIDVGQLGQRIKIKQTTETGLGDIIAAVRYQFFITQNISFPD